MNYCLVLKRWKLNAEEQAYTEKTLDRIDELMVELGIEFEDDDDEEKTEDIAITER